MCDLLGTRLYSFVVLKALSCGVVTALDLNDNAFSGSLPEWIGNLNSLTCVLRVSPAVVTMSVTRRCCGCGRSEMGLYDNDFSGTLPASLSNLGRVWTMGLSKNGFSGPIDVLTQMESLQ